MPSGQSPTDTAPFVFRGTVQQTGAVTMSHLDSEGAATVKVDEVIQAPDLLRRIAGQTITVYGEATLKPGQRATFFTDGLIFGESIAVHAKEVQPLEGAEPAGAGVELGAAPENPVDNLHAQRAQERFDAADLVVTGKVTSIHAAEPPPGIAAAAAGLGVEQGPSTRISEHEPLWNDAVIEVNEVHKGEAPEGQVVIRFPSSTDVKWFRAPKFQPGQEGVFMLHKDEPKAAGAGVAAAAVAVEGAEAYTALDPADFHPADQTHVIQGVIRPERER
jgi:hypothetical protein